MDESELFSKFKQFREIMAEEDKVKVVEISK